MWRSEKYKKFIRNKPCLLCGQPAVAHHESSLGNSGMGLKISDNYCIPLCPQHHEERHRLGVKTWCERYPYVHLSRLVLRLITEYLTGD